MPGIPHFLRTLPARPSYVTMSQVVARNSAPPGIDMQVNVLTSGYWPTYPIVECRLPSELSQGQTVRLPCCRQHSNPLLSP